MAVNIYIVEDHPFLQRMLQEFIGQTTNLQVCGVAMTAQKALDQLPTAAAQLVLVDVSLPDWSGIELVRLLRARGYAQPCLMFSSYQEAGYIQQALDAGANGYIFKGTPRDLAAAIAHVLDGERYLSPSAYTTLHEMRGR